MFVSRDELKLSYGVDMEIGKFFVDRRVPSDNLYWKKRLLYIAPHPGYLFIPVFSDLAFRMGIPKDDLLSEPHLELIEAILHSAGKVEFEQLSMSLHIAECMEIAKGYSRNNEFLGNLQSYFLGKEYDAVYRFGSAFPALTRADAYLFSLSYFPANTGKIVELVKAWYAMINFFLLMDDLEDIRADFDHQEENTVLEAGLTEEGVRRVNDIMNESFDILNLVNPVLANRIDFKRKTTDVAKIIESFAAQQRKGK